MKKRIKDYKDVESREKVHVHVYRNTSTEEHVMEPIYRRNTSNEKKPKQCIPQVLMNYTSNEEYNYWIIQVLRNTIKTLNIKECKY